MTELFDLLVNFLFMVGLFGIMAINGFGVWLLFNAWLVAKRERESKQRLQQFREAASLEPLQEEQEL
jgi:hypothetical protein